MTKTDWFKQQLKLIEDDVRELGCSELNYTILSFAPSTALTSLVTARQDYILQEVAISQHKAPPQPPGPTTPSQTSLQQQPPVLKFYSVSLLSNALMIN